MPALVGTHGTLAECSITMILGEQKKNQKDTSSGASRAAILSVGNTVRRIHREWNELQREFGKKWLSVDFDP